MVMLDNQAVLDALLLKGDCFSDLLRLSRSSFEEVSEAFGFNRHINSTLYSQT